jgi:GT2 family glycosyltransferase
MISVVVVYNNEQTLNEILLQSLKNQTSKFEIIPVDNTKGRFKSAAEALNYGGKRANGRYIMFVHQDVDLVSPTWLENVEKILEPIHDLGIAGIVGMSEKGWHFKKRWRGYIEDNVNIYSRNKTLQNPEEVQTLDGLLLIIPKLMFDKMQFDEKTFDGWHCYDADYCLRVRQFGLKAYAIPFFVRHGSFGGNIKDIFEYQRRLYYKHKKNHRHIYTTCREISFLTIKLHPIVEKHIPFKVRLLVNWLFNKISRCLK